MGAYYTSMGSTMKSIKGYEGLYSITKSGKVWSHRSNRYIKCSPTTRGYRKVALCHKGEVTTKFVHRLVMESYKPTLNQGLDVNHIDGDKVNNNLSNLEWCTRSENIKHAFRLKLSCNEGVKHSQSKLTELDIRYIRLSPRSNVELGKLYGVVHQTISNVRNGWSWNHI